MRRDRPGGVIRRDMLLVGAVILTIAILIYYVPIQNTFYADYNSFSPSSKPGLYDLGILDIPAYDTISVKLFSSSALVFGIVSKDSWNSFIGGNSSVLSFISKINGSYGSFSFTPATNAELYFVAGAPDNGQLPIFKVIVVTVAQHALSDYAILASLPGFALVLISVVYEQMKSAWYGFVRRRK